MIQLFSTRQTIGGPAGAQYTSEGRGLPGNFPVSLWASPPLVIMFGQTATHERCQVRPISEQWQCSDKGLNKN